MSDPSNRTTPLQYTFRNNLCVVMPAAPRDGAAARGLSAFELSMSQPQFAAVILAAGSGTRMKSAIPKVMHPVAGRPMIAYPLDAVRALSPAATVVVVGRQMDDLARIVAPAAEAIVQDPPLGTGDAVRAAIERLVPRGADQPANNQARKSA